MQDLPSSLRILLAEDDGNIRVLTEKMLKEAGHKVFSAVNGEEAVAIFRQHNGDFDIVVLDFSMPRLTGKGVYDSIRAIAPDMPVLFTTGHSPVELDSLLRDDARAGLLNKPYRATDLAVFMQELLTA